MATITVKLFDASENLVASVSGVDRSKMTDPPPKIVRYQDKFYTFTGFAENSRPVFHEFEPVTLD